MTSFEQIQQDIQTLPQEALDILAQFIQLLKKGSSATEENLQVAQPEKGSSTAILQFLQTHPLAPEHQRSAAEIDQQINEERAAWD